MIFIFLSLSKKNISDDTSTLRKLDVSQEQDSSEAVYEKRTGLAAEPEVASEVWRTDGDRSGLRGGVGQPLPSCLLHQVKLGATGCLYSYQDNGIYVVISANLQSGAYR